MLNISSISRSYHQYYHAKLNKSTKSAKIKPNLSNNKQIKLLKCNKNYRLWIIYKKKK